MELGYASTVHSAQGRTVDQAVMVIDHRTEEELLYVGMTRGRHDAPYFAFFAEGFVAERGHTVVRYHFRCWIGLPVGCL